MCGNVGIFGDIQDTEKRLFKDLLNLDIVRGKHGTGIIYVTQGNEYSWIKSAGTPGLLYKTDREQVATGEYDPFFNEQGLVAEPNLKALIGHNRHATVGKVSDETAHPFDFDNIVGVHNGTLRMPGCDLKYKNDFNVDSEVLFANINESSVPEVYSKVAGAMACVMWDKRSNRLNIWRNSERPLFVSVAKDKSKVCWASEEWILLDAIFQSGTESQWDSLKSVNTDTLYELVFEDGEVKWTSTKMEEKKYTSNFTTTTGPTSGRSTYVNHVYERRGKCIFSTSTSDYDPDESYYLWDTKAEVFVSIEMKTSKLSFTLPEPLSTLPDGMVAVWCTVLKEHRFYLPLNGKIGKEELERNKKNFTKAAAASNVVLLPDKRDDRSDSTGKPIESKIEKATIENELALFKSKRGDLNPENWIRVFLKAVDGNPHKVRMHFRYKGGAYEVLPSLAEYVVQDSGAFWVTRTPKIAGSNVDIKRMHILPEDRTYKGVGVSEKVSSLFDDMEDGNEEVFDVDNNQVTFSELVALIEEAGGGCYNCLSTPLPSDYSELTWFTTHPHSCDYHFLCPVCALNKGTLRSVN